MKAEPLKFIQAAPRVVFSTMYGNFANIVAWFICIFSHLIARGHVKGWSVRGHDRFISCYLSPTVPSVYFHTVLIDIKRQRKISASWFRGVYGLRSLETLGVDNSNPTSKILWLSACQGHKHEK